MKKACLFLCLGLVLCTTADAELLDRPGGVKIGQRMTLRPSVALSYTYDSNVDRTKRGDSGTSSMQVSPQLELDYIAENWKLTASVFYRYYAYLTGYSKQLNNSSYGERLAFSWNDGQGAGKGWSLSLTESYRFVSQNDDATDSGGRGVYRDRQEFNGSGTLQRRLNEWWHAGLMGSYYMLDYDNDEKKYAPLYGWTRWQAGGQIGFIASQWTDIFIQGGYQGYTQDNDTYRGYESGPHSTGRIDETSKGYTLHIGFGSYMTERITYRLSGGWSRFEYGDVDQTDGFTYRANLDWKIGRTWRTTLIASSYYHPSERDYGSACRTDYVSWGLTKSLVRGKLSSTLDITYRHEDHGYSQYAISDYKTDIMTFRVGLNYTLNRFLSAYSNVEYQKELNDGNSAIGSKYDYDRWRLTVGFRLTY